MDGKDLEKLLQESCKIQGADCTRLRDAGWQGEQTQRRFTVKNICDFIIFADGAIIYLECKHTKTSLPLSRLTQQEDLIKKLEQCIPNLFAGYLTCYSGEFYYISAGAVDKHAGTGKKSISHKDAMMIGISFPLFTPAKARKQRLDVSALIHELKIPF